MKRKLVLKKIFPVVLFLVSLPIIFPLLKSGYFPTHDGEWAVIRLAEMHRELCDFQFPPRWADFLNHGYGYPLFLFTYPFPYYLAEIFYLLGFGLIGSIKIVFILSVLLSALFMYLLGKTLWGKVGGFLATLFYLYLPFRLVDLYIRGSIGESLAFAFFPLLFYLGLKYLETPDDKKIFVFTSLSLVFLILTHNVMALVFIPLWIAFFLYLTRSNWQAFLSFLMIVLLGFSLSAFFWLPAIFEKKFIFLSILPIADKSKHFVSLSQLIFPSWTYGTLPSFQIGWAHLITLLLSLLFSVRRKKTLDRFQKALLLYCYIVTLLLVFLLLPNSYFIWEAIPLLKEVDFPWRLLGLIGFFICLPLGLLGGEKKLRPILFFLGILVILVTIKYARPAKYIFQSESFYTANDATTTSADELMPIWVKDKPQKRQNQKVEIIKGRGEVSGVLYNSKKAEFSVNTSKTATIQINTIYYPGWQVFVDGKNTPIDHQNVKGLITFQVPKGKSRVLVKFGETPLRLFSDIISLVSGLVLLFLMIKEVKTGKFCS